MKKIIAIVFSVFFLISIQAVTIFGGNHDYMVISKNQQFQDFNACLEPGDIFFDFDVTSPTSDQLCLGVEFDGTYFYVTGAFDSYDHMVHFFSKNGDHVSSAIQPTSDYWGWRDMAFDGTYMYSCAEDSIEKWHVSGLPDSPVIEVVDEFPGPEDLNRGLAYDPESGHFWTVNLSSTIYEINTDGDIINTFTNDFEIYGMAWDDCSPGGPYLWMYDQKFDGGHGCHIRQFDPINGVFTGVVYPGEYNEDYPLSLAGGACFVNDWDGKSIFVGLTQDFPYDHVFGLEICDFIPEIDIQVDSISGGLGVKTVIKNNGSSPAYDVPWSIDIDNAWITLRGGHGEGVIDVPGNGETETIRHLSLFAFGKDVLITVTAGDDIKNATASWVLGPLVLGLT
jgi:hypothetical protein